MNENTVVTRQNIMSGLGYVRRRYLREYPNRVDASRNLLAFLKVLYTLPGALGPPNVTFEMLYQSYISAQGNNRFGGENKKTLDKEITVGDAFTMMWLMWLDGIHDKYIDIGFISFLESRKRFFNPKIIDSIKTLSTSRQFPVFVNEILTRYSKIYGSSSEKFVNTKLIPSMVSDTPPNFTSVSGGKWERVFKSIIGELYRHTELTYSQTLESTESTYVSIDQETNLAKPITDLVRTGTNIYPLITTGSLHDPGRGLVTVGSTARNILGFRQLLGVLTSTPEIYLNSLSKENYNKLTKNEPKRNKKTQDEKELLEHFKNAMESLYIGELDIRFNIGATPFMHVSTVVDPSYDYILRLNGKSLQLAVSSGEAKKLGIDEQMSKYFGDFLQLLYVIRKTYRAGYDTYLGTGDANFALENVFYRQLFNQPLNLIIDSGQDLGSKLYIYGEINRKIATGEVRVKLKTLQQVPEGSRGGGEVSGMALKTPVSGPPPRNTTYNNNLRNLGLNQNISLINNFTKLMKQQASIDRFRNSKFNRLKDRKNTNLAGLYQRFITAFKARNWGKVAKTLNLVNSNRMVVENVEEVARRPPTARRPPAARRAPTAPANRTRNLNEEVSSGGLRSIRSRAPPRRYRPY